MKTRFYILLTILFSACNSDSSEKKELDPDPTVIEKAKSTHSDIVANKLIDKVLEDKITDTLMTMPFVKKTNQYLDSLTGHKHGIAFTIDSVGNNEIFVMAGYNDPERFETYYRFTIYPKTFDIMIEYPETGELISIDQYIKLKKD